MKSFTTQGGIRVPFIIRYPPFHAHASASPGGVIGQQATVMDIAATVLDLAGIRHPAEGGEESKGTFRGREVVGMKGKTWRGMFERGDVCHDDDEPLGWEVGFASDPGLSANQRNGKCAFHRFVANRCPQLHGRAGMRIGDWKINFVPPPFGPGKWQLYNLRTDPGEVFDVKDEEPEKYTQLCAAWERYLDANGVVWGAPMPSETIDGEGLDEDVVNDGTGWMKKG